MFNIKKLFARDKQEARPPIGELSSYTSMYYSKSQIAPYNPDTLVQKKGNLKIYQKMKEDDQIKALLTMKKNAALSTGWNIVGKDIERNDFIEQILFELDIDQKLFNIMSAIEYGFSVSEIIYSVKSGGDYDGKIIISDVKTRPPDSFQFETGLTGHIEKLIQYQDMGERELPLEKFVIYSHNPEFGNPYGNSDLRAAYRSWFSKDIIVRFWNIYLERFGQPTVIGTYDTGVSTTAQSDLENVMENFQSKYAIKVPEGVKLDLLEATRRGDAGYDLAIEKHNTMMARAMLVPDLLGFSEMKGGSYALGKKQVEVFIWVLERLRRELQETIINRQIIKKIMDLNYGDSKDYPEFRFRPLLVEDKNETIKNIVEIIKSGIMPTTKADEDYLREELNLPYRDEEQEPAAPAPSTPKTDTDGLPTDDDLEDGGKIKKMAARRQKTEYEKKIDFEAIEKNLDGLEYKSALKIGSTLDKAVEELISKIIRDKIIEEKNFRAIEGLSLKYVNELTDNFGQFLTAAFEMGERDVIREVTDKKNFATAVAGLQPKEAMDYFRMKKFWLSGTEKEAVLRKTKAILYEGLKSGASLAHIKFKLEEAFKTYKVYQKVAVAGGTVKMMPIKKIEGRLATVIRTNTTDAYNQGRKIALQSPVVKPLVPAYQFSAILDDRTTDICLQNDGMIRLADDPIWGARTPPLHYNCRSMLIPILSHEKYTVSKVKVAGTPAEGFGG